MRPRFLYSIFYHLESYCFCINPYSRERFIDRKPEQIKLANKVGISTPLTLITNVPADARNFLKSLGGKCIYKTLLPHLWDNDNDKKMAIARATLIDENSLESDFTIESCSLLLQEYINKKYDVRVVVMGHYMVAVYFNAVNGDAPVDWRPAYQESEVIIEKIEIPDALRERIINFMSIAGINFGSFDFSIDKNNQWWFLEVNTQGQFLWLENEIELGLLDNFTRFILSKNKEYKGVKKVDSKINHYNFCNSSYYKENVEGGHEPQEQWFFSAE